jgi:hypothetical protein
MMKKPIPSASITMSVIFEPLIPAALKAGSGQGKDQLTGIKKQFLPPRAPIGIL